VRLKLSVADNPIDGFDQLFQLHIGRALRFRNFRHGNDETLVPLPQLTYGVIMGVLPLGHSHLVFGDCT
jgi:hypothetical protein